MLAQLDGQLLDRAEGEFAGRPGDGCRGSPGRRSRRDGRRYTGQRSGPWLCIGVDHGFGRGPVARSTSSRLDLVIGDVGALGDGEEMIAQVGHASARGGRRRSAVPWPPSLSHPRLAHVPAPGPASPAAANDCAGSGKLGIVVEGVDQPMGERRHRGQSAGGQLAHTRVVLGRDLATETREAGGDGRDDVLISRSRTAPFGRACPARRRVCAPGGGWCRSTAAR